MMNTIQSFLPLFGVFLGWVLSEGGKLLTDKRANRRKLNKLIFYMLELRHQVYKEYSLEQTLERYAGFLKQKIEEQTSFNLGSIDGDIVAVKGDWKRVLDTYNLENDRLEVLRHEIDSILADLSEVEPFLAYQLSGRYNIRQRLRSAKDYLAQLEDLSEVNGHDLKDWLNPTFLNALLSEIDECLLTVARKNGRTSLKRTRKTITEMEMQKLDPKTERMFDELLREFTPKP